MNDDALVKTNEEFNDKTKYYFKPNDEKDTPLKYFTNKTPMDKDKYYYYRKITNDDLVGVKYNEYANTEFIKKNKNNSNNYNPIKLLKTQFQGGVQLELPKDKTIYYPEINIDDEYYYTPNYDTNPIKYAGKVIDKKVVDYYDDNTPNISFRFSHVGWLSNIQIKLYKLKPPQPPQPPPTSNGGKKRRLTMKSKRRLNHCSKKPVLRKKRYTAKK